MTALDLLATLQARGVELVAAGDRLRWRPREALTPAEVERLRDHKAELLRLLAEPKTADSPAPPLRLDSVTVREVLGDARTPRAFGPFGPRSPRPWPGSRRRSSPATSPRPRSWSGGGPSPFGSRSTR